MAARASYIAGFAGTATVLAGDAIRHPALRHDGALFHRGVRRRGGGVCGFREIATGQSGPAARHLRYRSGGAQSRRVCAAAESAGDLDYAACVSTAAISRAVASVRAILDTGGLREVTIFASGGFDEDSLAALRAGKCADRRVRRRHQPDHLRRRADARLRYKMQEYAGPPRRKRSAKKADLAGPQAVWRRYAPGAGWPATRSL